MCLIAYHCKLKIPENETHLPHPLQQDNGCELLDLLYNYCNPINNTILPLFQANYTSVILSSSISSKIYLICYLF